MTDTSPKIVDLTYLQETLDLNEAEIKVLAYLAIFPGIDDVSILMFRKEFDEVSLKDSDMFLTKLFESDLYRNCSGEKVFRDDFRKTVVEGVSDKEFGELVSLAVAKFDRLIHISPTSLTTIAHAKYSYLKALQYIIGQYRSEPSLQNPTNSRLMHRLDEMIIDPHNELSDDLSQIINPMDRAYLVKYITTSREKREE